jgi:hypothetical protein
MCGKPLQLSPPRALTFTPVKAPVSTVSEAVPFSVRAKAAPPEAVEGWVMVEDEGASNDSAS